MSCLFEKKIMELPKNWVKNIKNFYYNLEIKDLPGECYQFIDIEDWYFKRVRDLSEDSLLKIMIWLNNKSVYLIEDNTRSKTGEIVTEILNSRFVYSQIGMRLQEMTKRQIWYIVDQRLNGLDLSGNKKQQYISLSEMVKNFCEKLTDFYNVPYWGLVLDELYINAKARATILDLEGEETGLNAKTFPEFKNAPFFFLICEKEDTLKSMLNELKKRGYTCGFYGIITQGYGSTNVVRLLMELSEISKFYVFVAHDFDIDGLKIFFDLKRYFPCESVGINPTFLETITVDNNEISQDYSGHNGNAKKSQIKGAINMINDLFGSKTRDKFDEEITDSTYLKYEKWIEGCIERKIELDALLAYRLNEDLNLCKSRDLVDFLETLLEDGTRVYDLNRYKKPEKREPEEKIPEVTRPQIIDETMEELKSLVVKPIIENLKRRNLNEDSAWESLIGDKLNELVAEAKEIYEQNVRVIEDQFNKIIEENKTYNGSLKEVNDIIEDQDQQIFDHSSELNEELEERVQEQILILRLRIEDTEIYKSMARELKKYRNKILDTLKEPKNRTIMIEDVLTDLRAYYMDLKTQDERKKIIYNVIKKLESVS